MTKSAEELVESLQKLANRKDLTAGQLKKILYEVKRFKEKEQKTVDLLTVMEYTIQERIDRIS